MKKVNTVVFIMKNGEILENIIEESKVNKYSSIQDFESKTGKSLNNFVQKEPTNDKIESVYFEEVLVDPKTIERPSI